MAKLNLISEIVDKDTKVWLSWDGFERVCSDDIVNFIASIPQEDDTIDLHINCPGGSVFEGMRMYDALRQSGKKINAIVEGVCASMATIILLAAPKDRRFAYQNATLLIHNPEAGWLHTGGYPDRLTADNIEDMSEKLRIQAEALRETQQKIVDIYVDRTGSDAETLQSIMDNDMPITIDKAIELGFITSTLAPNTASAVKNPNMSNKDQKVEVGQSWLSRLIAKAGFSSFDAVKFNDLVFNAANGDSFSVEREEGNYAIGDKATPDGEFVMEDGSTVSIKGGVIASIVDAKAELKNPENGDTIDEDEAQALLNEYFDKCKKLQKALEDAKNDKEESESAHAAELNDIKASLDAKDAIIAEKDSTIEDLNNRVNENKEILDIVNAAGGRAWLDALGSSESNGAPKVDNNGGDESKFGAGFIADRAKNSRRFR